MRLREGFRIPHMDAGIGVIIFMAVVLKIPVAAACWLLWAAFRAEPDPVEGEDGGNDRDPRHFRREPSRPKGPRRGPHAPEALPLPCPEDGELRVARRPARPSRVAAR